jgi:hypothetical protein
MPNYATWQVMADARDADAKNGGAVSCKNTLTWMQISRRKAPNLSKSASF